MFSLSHEKRNKYSNYLFSGAVDTLDSIGLGLVGYKLGMFLDHKHEFCFTLKKELKRFYWVLFEVMH